MQLTLALLVLVSVPREDESWPTAEWTRAAPAEVSMDAGRLHQARDYAISGGGSGCVLRHRKLVILWGDLRGRYDLKSSTRSSGAAALDLAILGGKTVLDDKAIQSHPTLGDPTASNRQTGSKSLYGPSPVIRGITWAAASTIRRAAQGSDNWPMTWGDDDAQYTAYGDGWGFDPRVPKKLGLGLARITGGPEDFAGVNLRAASVEQLGDGARGKKASGILMVDGVLYLLVRNAAQSQWAWSKDRGQTWSWSEWRFTSGMSCPTVVNFGANYRGARDEFVYLYSPDAESAYQPADRMTLSRVPKDRILDRGRYEFFVRMDGAGRPVWTRDVAERGAIFSEPGRCGRSIVSYHAPSRRYLWVQTLPDAAARRRAGLAIYDAPEPWGPWTSVYRAEPWDVDCGDTAGFPTRWMERDGKTLYLVFSGDDSFAVRKATLMLSPSAGGK